MVPKKAFIVAALSAMVQYYDYHLYGFFAARLSYHFFPEGNQVVQLLQAYFVMAISVLAKPIGALALGRIGDIYGRSATMNISLAGTAAASLFISLIPSHYTIGILSAFLLLLARMAVCAFVSSGTDGIRIFIYEQINKKNQCLGNGLVTASTMVGSFIAALSAWFFSLDHMPYYSWRFAFALGAVFGLSVLYLRHRLEVDKDIEVQGDAEYHDYQALKITAILRKHWKLFVLGVILAGTIGSTNQFLVIFLGTYCFKVLGVIDQSVMQFYISVGIVCYMFGSIIGGYVADRCGRLRVARIAVICAVCEFIYMSILLGMNQFSIPLYLLGCVTMPFITMPALAFVKQSIPVVIRYRMFSLAHALGSICISAPTAFMATFMYIKTSLPWFPVLYFITTILVMITVITILCKHYNANKIT